MAIDDYLKKNGIVPRGINDATLEQIEALRYREPQAYYKKYYQLALDELLYSIDYQETTAIMRIFEEQLSGLEHKNLLEIYCGSGIVGGYLAGLPDCKYSGIDPTQEAIRRARQRARLNGLNQEIFRKADIFSHRNVHDAVIGIYAANDIFLNPDKKVIDKLTKISDRIFLAAKSELTQRNLTIEVYRRNFLENGYSLDVLSDDSLFSGATQNPIFVLEANRTYGITENKSFQLH
jgi:SAM-dependent methyltransferase